MAAFLIVALVALFSPACADESNPISKVLELLSGLEAKITKEGEAAKKTHEETSAWCDERSANVGFEIKTGKSEVASLEADIQKESSIISSSTSKVNDISASIASNEADLKAATEVRAKEQASFAAEEKELTEVIGMLGRAIQVISREMQGGAAMVQLKDAQNIVDAFRVMVEASAMSSADASRLTALVQNSQESDDLDAGAPAAAAYESHSGDIVSVLQGLEDKADEQLTGLRSKETTALHNFEMLHQSLGDELKYGNKDMAATQKAGAAASEAKANAEGNLAITSKDLEGDIAQAADLAHDCKVKAEDFVSASASRAEELKALGEAKKIVAEATGGAEELSYGLNQVSFLQRLSSSSDLAQFEAVRLLRDLAKKEHSPVLEQLATRIVSALRFGAKNGEDPFEKVKEMISAMLSKLEEQGSAEASAKEYCDDELAKSTEKKTEKTALVDKLSTSIDQMSSKAAHLKEQVGDLNKALAEIAGAQAEMNKLRHGESSEFVENKAAMEQGVSGVEGAIKILRDYYAAQGKSHEAAGGAGNSIVAILEVCLSDFTKGLADMVATEDTAQTSYDRATQENKLETATKEQDVKYKGAEAAKLDKAVAEAVADRSSTQDQLDSIHEYLEKLKEQCVAKAEPYAERKARREAELAGLKQALEILDAQSSFVQKKVNLRTAQPHVAA